MLASDVSPFTKHRNTVRGNSSGDWFIAIEDDPKRRGGSVPHDWRFVGTWICLNRITKKLV